MKWQLIETAPKDGTAILGFSSWVGLHVTWYDEDVGWCKTTVRWQPTHWLPIPEAPE